MAIRSLPSSSRITYQPHIQMFGSNQVNIFYMGREIITVTTYGKIMAFVRKLFCVKFYEMRIHGRMHYILPEENHRITKGLHALEEADWIATRQRNY